MPLTRKLLAAFDRETGEVAIVASAMAGRRQPATRRYTSEDAAKRWVDAEATALGGVSVEWLDRLPGVAERSPSPDV